jgi:hypothetical protein
MIPFYSQTKRNEIEKRKNRRTQNAINTIA